MTDRIPKSVLLGGAVLAPLFLVLFAYSRPGYFTSQTYLGGMLLLELLVAALWMYRQVFFPLVLLAFLFAGTGFAVGGGWTVARWVVLGIGAAAGSVIVLKDHRLHFGVFHTIALFAILAAFVSAAVSTYTDYAMLKALSLLLLFLYASTGARLAVAGRESRYFAGLLLGCEIFIGVLAVCYLVLHSEVMGNPNSLGAVTGVVGAPILLWGTLMSEKPSVRNRRMALYLICMFLVVRSHSRASMGAAFISSGILCLALRKYKLFAEGMAATLIVVAATAIINPSAFSNAISTVNSSIVYKSDDPTHTLLFSRESPWQAAMESIGNHFWFGTGFGTTNEAENTVENLDQFSSSKGVAVENGSSYLTIVEWVGMLGVLPFLFLLLVIVGKVQIGRAHV